MRGISLEEELEDLLRLAKRLLNEGSVHPVSQKNSEEKLDSESPDQIALQAEELRRGKQKRAAVLSVLKAGSVFTLFLSLAFQHNTVLFISAALLGCTGLGAATYLEKER